MLWEASDRVCGKRLKAIIPTLIEAMVRYGHLAAAPEVRTALLKMSAATIDRALQPQRERCGMLRRQPGSVSTIRRSIPVRTFSDWDDPPPGFVEADLYFDRTRKFWDAVRTVWGATFKKYSSITLRGPIDKLGLFQPLFACADRIAAGEAIADDDNTAIIRSALADMGVPVHD